MQMHAGLPCCSADLATLSVNPRLATRCLVKLGDAKSWQEAVELLHSLRGASAVADVHLNLISPHHTVITSNKVR